MAQPLLVGAAVGQVGERVVAAVVGLFGEQRGVGEVGGDQVAQQLQGLRVAGAEVVGLGVATVSTPIASARWKSGTQISEPIPISWRIGCDDARIASAVVADQDAALAQGPPGEALGAVDPLAAEAVGVAGGRLEDELVAVGGLDHRRAGAGQLEGAIGGELHRRLQVQVAGRDLVLGVDDPEEAVLGGFLSTTLPKSYVLRTYFCGIQNTVRRMYDAVQFRTDSLSRVAL